MPFPPCPLTCPLCLSVGSGHLTLRRSLSSSRFALRRSLSLASRSLCAHGFTARLRRFPSLFQCFPYGPTPSRTCAWAGRQHRNCNHYTRFNLLARPSQLRRRRCRQRSLASLRPRMFQRPYGSRRHLASAFSARLKRRLRLLSACASAEPSRPSSMRCCPRRRSARASRPVRA